MQLSIVSNLNTQPYVGGGGLVAGPVWELQTGPTDWLVLLGVTADFAANVFASTALTFGLGVPAARGTPLPGQATLVIDQAWVGENNMLTDALPGTDLLTAWQILPTIPANFLRRATINGANGGVGGGRYRHLNWRFPTGIKIIPNSSLVLWGIALSNTLPFPIDSALIIED